MLKKLSILILIGCILVSFPENSKAQFLPASKPTVTNVTLTNANQEYSYTIPEGTVGITVQSRTALDFKLGSTSGQSGTTYFTVKAGTSYFETTLATYKAVLYMQSANAGQVVEIITW